MQTDTPQIRFTHKQNRLLKSIYEGYLGSTLNKWQWIRVKQDLDLIPERLPENYYYLMQRHAEFRKTNSTGRITRAAIEREDLLQNLNQGLSGRELVELSKKWGQHTTIYVLAKRCGIEFFSSAHYSVEQTRLILAEFARYEINRNDKAYKQRTRSQKERKVGLIEAAQKSRQLSLF
jgi:hypothetical protein